MTATTLDRPLNLKPLLLLALLTIAVLWGAHAVARHGDEAQQVRSALSCNGPSEVWRFRSWRRQKQAIVTCELPDGRWGLSIIERVWYGLKERSSYIVKDGTRSQLWEYVSSKDVYPGAMP